ncbi:HNH endonuclease [Burkholderia stagnalis]|uniref:HNH endonuclease signature motif containing protein n=1 Tax=Burkholderia stagnalis TaxID=1503054 RepID=UPI0009BD8E8D|nr:HNH endonuclease [Burkholderia stagnalis]
MIPVTAAKEPPHFNERVRERGLDAIAELVGEAPKKKRPGAKRAKVADERSKIPGKCFPPFWREALPDMLDSYSRVCAYLGLYIEHGTGSPSVDHVVPKSKKWDQVYEWDNYRLACSLVNSKKNNLDLSLDPFAIKDGTFALELVGFQVIAGPLASQVLARRVDKTIDVLGLNLRECCEARREYVEAYDTREIQFKYLLRRAPFVAAELRRQGKLHPEDV